jgi:lipopolysaccharide/colanic/teichoic acid biosynthesis glycosyltransferase
MVILSPIVIITAVLIKLTSKGPILFIHKRVSQNDALFTIYKFRSMYLDAEKDGAVWTEDYKKDPRITPIGRFIRATHLDEIPQLVNILKGDISFVGPRPERPEFTGKLEKDIPYYALRHSVKAGLTGWAQVNYKYGSSVEDAREKLKYDFYYIKNRTIFFDILIIMKTIARLFTY